MTISSDQIQSLYDSEVVDSEGDKVGGVGQVYLDDQSGQPSWVTVKTGLFGNNETFVPLQDASISESTITVPYTKDFIKDAPNIDGESHLDDNDQQNLYQYYNLGGTAGTRGQDANDTTGNDTTGNDTTGNDTAGYGTDREVNRGADTGTSGYDDTSSRTAADTGAVGGGTAGTGVAGTQAGTTAGGDVPDSIVRREEQLQVGKQQVEAGRLRIRKHVVTEQQTVTVPVEREEVQVVREPISGGQSGGTLGDDEVEVTLRAEEPVADKQVVDAERIGIQRNTVTENRDVTTDVSREEVEIDRDGDGVPDRLQGRQNGTDR
ncbi:DUF2382 domain-containing protein [Nakamurella aerolata]|uniref:PRC and DUF2382 domain-containing protein n=1 Tax=Nakamurella aerolata TaxID=1656892 RepID=A0A849A8J4_9ACTN|nr:PRC and DUF2382 domain-containing protein [Nakamurella aerolata]NNG36327.1 PRC and DUF2382 domain-containing protein [Nakamurella aerolata]